MENFEEWVAGAKPVLKSTAIPRNYVTQLDSQTYQSSTNPSRLGNTPTKTVSVPNQEQILKVIRSLTVSIICHLIQYNNNNTIPKSFIKNYLLIKNKVITYYKMHLIYRYMILQEQTRLPASTKVLLLNLRPKTKVLTFDLEQERLLPYH